MAKFCTRCGRPLEEGEVCNCGQEVTQAQQTAQVQPEAAQAQQAAQVQPEAAQAQQAAPQPEAAQAQQAQQQGYAQNGQQFQQQGYAQNGQQFQQQGYAQNSQQFQQTQQAVTGFLGKMFKNFLDVIKHPVTGGREIILAGEIGVGIALIVLQGLLTAFFGAIGASKTLGAMFDAMSYYSSDDMSVPYAKIIFGTLAISVALSFVLALLLFLGNLIMKNTVSFGQMIGAVSVRSSVVIVTNIIAMIVCLINPVGGMMVFAVGNIWGFFAILQAMPIASETMRDDLPLIMILVYLVFVVINYFCVKEGVKLYLPNDMADSLSSLRSLSSFSSLW